MIRLTLRIGSDSGALHGKVDAFAELLAKKYGGSTVTKGTGHWVDTQTNRLDSETSYSIVCVVNDENSVAEIVSDAEVMFRGLQDCNTVMMERENVNVNFIQTT